MNIKTKYDEKDIWGVRQNHPELVVQDCIEEFNLSKNQADRLRGILLERGVNKWLWARRLFIKLKHEVKQSMLKDPKNKILQKVYERMQNIAKMPRFVLWGTHVHKKMINNDKDVKILGRHC